MTFSTEWETIFRNNTHISVWPWSDLVSFVMRYARPQRPDFKVLEVGCGAGANIPFFLSLGVQYYAVEGSVTIVQKLKEKFPSISDNIVATDFTYDIPFQNNFDLVVDRAALTSNSTKGIKQGLENIHKKMKKGSKFIGIDWYSTKHSDYHRGKRGEDQFTKTGYKKGMFADLGNIHFSNKSHIENLFSKFTILVLQHKIIESTIPSGDYNFASWNFVAEKNK